MGTASYMRNITIASDRRQEKDEGMTNTSFTDKVTLTGPRPYGGTYTTTTSDPTVARLVGKGYRITRQWTVTTDANGKLVSLPLN